MKSVAVLPRSWPLLFPLTFLVHIAEEYWCGGGFYNWARVLGMKMDGTRFLQINAIAWTVMLLLSLLAVLVSHVRWVMVSFAAAVLLNGSAHTAASIVTASYSPGLFSGLLLWVPLGVYTLQRVYAEMSRRVFWGAVVWGLALHALVTFAARLG
ncbi:MAG TPA: HXXEE domain-containing protein [Blastocatellia bacterium]|nr:HXXEE domain-containing protein [Blastocatellia bacterium]HMV87092.1 HXXEE domain-containing protein [Blastocatellia bacterium]HMX27185.1 HXXEE domain-containing protein [Blastocatellia bacterium]HMZ20674.1 HXXEE domain-containing protein [Blastocatellia bacterium]HNG33889.1 HXXEE domain-containing protein [Blastocatellia bacterium]